MDRSRPAKPERRDQVDRWVRALTRAVVLAATGASAVIGVVVAREHPGAGSTPPKDTGASTSTTTTTPGTSAGSAGSSGSSATGDTTTTTAPTTTTTRPVVTSGGTSR